MRKTLSIVLIFIFCFCLIGCDETIKNTSLSNITKDEMFKSAYVSSENNEKENIEVDFNDLKDKSFYINIMNSSVKFTEILPDEVPAYNLVIKSENNTLIYNCMSDIYAQYNDQWYFVNCSNEDKLALYDLLSSYIQIEMHPLDPLVIIRNNEGKIIYNVIELGGDSCDIQFNDFYGNTTIDVVNKNDVFNYLIDILYSRDSVYNTTNCIFDYSIKLKYNINIEIPDVLQNTYEFKFHTGCGTMSIYKNNDLIGTVTLTNSEIITLLNYLSPNSIVHECSYEWVTSLEGHYKKMTCECCNTLFIEEAHTFVDGKCICGEKEIIEEIYYEVVFNNTDLEDNKVKDGSILEKPIDPVKDGYKFCGWYLDSDCTVKYDFSEIITNNLNLYAKWEKQEIYYEVSFVDYNGVILKKDLVLENGSAIPPDDPYREGYEFVGWSKGYDKIACELIVEAQYKKIKETIYKVTFDLNGGSKYSGKFVQNVSKIEDIVMPVIVKKGYIIDDYTYEKNDVNKTIVVKPNWIRNPNLFKLEIYLEEEIYLEGYYSNNEKIYIELPSKEYYDLVSDIDIPIVMPEKDLKINLSWVKQKFFLTVNYNSDQIDSEIYEYEAGDIIDKPITSPQSFFKRGYDFDGWDVEFPFEIYEDTTINVVWIPYCYNITFISNGAEYLEYEKIQILYDDYITLPRVRKAGYKFEGWYYYSVEIKDGQWKQICLTTDINLEAKWTYAKEYYEFGRYPQSHVSDTSLIEKLNEITETNEMGYYEYNGEEYYKIDAKPVVENKIIYSDGTYAVNGDAWFKVEPIKWNVYGENNYTLKPQKLLDVIYFAENNCPYSDSYLRIFLNFTFLERAFTSYEIDKIKLTSSLYSEVRVEGNTVSYYDIRIKDKVLNASVLDDTVKLLATDYAIARGATLTEVKSANGIKYYGNYWIKEQIYVDNLTYRHGIYDSYRNKLVEKNAFIKGVGIYMGIRIDLE